MNAEHTAAVRSSDAKPGTVGKRHRARRMALQMLYQREHGESPLAEIFDRFDLRDYVAETEHPVGDSGDEAPAEPRQRPKGPPAAELEDAFSYARQLVEGALGNADTIDDLIRRFAQNWRIERMPSTDRNILRLAIYEMLHEKSVPKVVIVDEAIELAKRFGSESSSSFVNGLLDGILKSGALDEASTETSE